MATLKGAPAQHSRRRLAPLALRRTYEPDLDRQVQALERVLAAVQDGTPPHSDEAASTQPDQDETPTESEHKLALPRGPPVAAISL